MYCPKCGTTNPDQAKFCRACGTNLEAVTLTLIGQTLPGSQKEWLEKRSKGVRETVAGAVLFGVALLAFLGLLIGAAASGEAEVLIAWFGLGMPWVIWGTIRLVKGIPDLVESKMMLREMQRLAGWQANVSPTPVLPSANELRMPVSASTAPEKVSPSSVTEYTTELLGDERPPQAKVMTPDKQTQ
jgi:hypothetical protein